MLLSMNHPGSRSGPDTSGMRSAKRMKPLFMRTFRGWIRARKRLRSMSAENVLCLIKSMWTLLPCPAFILKKRLRPGHRRQPIRMAWSVRTGRMAGSLRIVKSLTASAAEFLLVSIMMRKTIIILPIIMSKARHRWSVMPYAVDSIMAG